ncbi:1-aminocyclopropane-1-carboxylate oxidase homolog 1-like [Aristolochia californica]|uniref:1-aminocyclopropane-1-carboxylate oxidase homolog 1-like n=1 Tax=Aristolochia californica TaxID=171875 RepID=UPI0035E1ACC1
MAEEEQIPIVDLAGIDGVRRAEIIDEVRRASEKWGFYQVINHGIPINILEEMMEGVRSFNEAKETGVEAKKYDCHNSSKVQFQTDLNIDGAYPNWRNSLVVEMAPEPPSPEEVPAACREILFDYVKQATKLGEDLYGIISEALCLEPGYFKERACMNGLRVISHYYPPCPQPDLTFGTNKHTDPCFLTILLQDQVGGLQLLHQDRWISIQPVHGALVINNGDLLQLMSNDTLISLPHRVLANKTQQRVSVACFFSAYRSKRSFGPIKELITEEKPAIYRDTMADEYFIHYLTRSDFSTALEHFKKENRDWIGQLNRVQPCHVKREIADDPGQEGNWQRDTIISSDKLRVWSSFCRGFNICSGRGSIGGTQSSIEESYMTLTPRNRTELELLWKKVS